MKYEQLEKMGEEKFRRLRGVKRSTFEKMKTIIEAAHQQKRIKGGRPSKLSIADQLLMALEYIREYRTYFHTGKSYGVSESSAYKTIKWIEDTLIKHPDFGQGEKNYLKAIMSLRLY